VPVETLEVFTVLVNLLDERLNGLNVDNIKKIIQEVLIEHDQSDLTNQVCDNVNSDSYVSAIKSNSSKIYVSRGPTLEVPTFTNFFVPEENHADRFTSSNDTKKIVLRPAKCALKINKSPNYCACLPK